MHCRHLYVLVSRERLKLRKQCLKGNDEVYMSGKKTCNKINFDSRDSISPREISTPFALGAQKLRWVHQIVTIFIIHLGKKSVVVFGVGSWSRESGVGSGGETIYF